MYRERVRRLGTFTRTQLCCITARSALTTCAGTLRNSWSTDGEGPSIATTSALHWRRSRPISNTCWTRPSTDDYRLDDRVTDAVVVHCWWRSRPWRSGSKPLNDGGDSDRMLSPLADWRSLNPLMHSGSEALRPPWVSAISVWLCSIALYTEYIHSTKYHSSLKSFISSQTLICTTFWWHFHQQRNISRAC